MNAAQLINQTSGAVEYYTPSNIIEAARLTMGCIDLDPASCMKANETVKAKRYFTREQNGLNSSWHDKIWMNKKGACSCLCHNEHVKSAGIRTRNHLNISTVTGKTSEPFVLNASEKRQESERFVADAESLSRFTEAIIAGNVSIAGTGKDEILFLRPSLDQLELAENVSRLGPRPLNISIPEEHLGMAYLSGAEIATDCTHGNRLAFGELHQRDLKSIDLISSNTGSLKRDRITSGGALSLTMHAVENEQQGLLFNGHCLTGSNARATGSTNALTVETQDCLHKITSFLFRLQTAPELSREISCQLANLATTLKEANRLLPGAKAVMPWRLSFIISSTCDDCAGCCCVERPANLFMNHPFGRQTNKSWIDKLIYEFDFQNIEQACCITFACTSEAWYKPLLRFPQCYLSPRTNYVGPDGQPVTGVTKGSVVTYLGPNVTDFITNFEPLGSVVIPAAMWRQRAHNHMCDLRVAYENGQREAVTV